MSLRCYRCGSSLAALTLPLSRLDNCPSCNVDLHVCRMCTYYRPAVPTACIEDDAEEVADKTSRNFCEYFRPSPSAFDGSLLAGEHRARAALESLFGGDPTPDQADATEQDDDSRANEALQKANALFKGKG